MMKVKQSPRKQYFFAMGKQHTWIKFEVKQVTLKAKSKIPKRFSWFSYIKSKLGAGTPGTYHNILRERVSAEGAIIKHDLVEGLWCHSDHSAAIISGVPMLRDDGLSHRDALLTSLGLLKRVRERGQKRQRRKRRKDRK